MIPFDRTWPYERVMGDLYVNECPFCKQEQVLLPFKDNDLREIRTGRKTLLVFPCCRNKLTVVDCDSDYLLTDRTLRRPGGT